jgi:hypothetical protein
MKMKIYLTKPERQTHSRCCPIICWTSCAFQGRSTRERERERERERKQLLSVPDDLFSALCSSYLCSSRYVMRQQSRYSPFRNILHGCVDSIVARDHGSCCANKGKRYIEKVVVSGACAQIALYPCPTIASRQDK